MPPKGSIADLAPKPSIAKNKGAAKKAAAADAAANKLTATLRVVCTSPPGAKLNGFPVTLGLRDKTTKQIVPPTVPSTASCRSCSWEFPVVFLYDPARKTNTRNPFPGRIRGDFVESGKGEWNEDFYMYLRIMQNKGEDYVTGLKITMGCITWAQVQEAQTAGVVIETRVPGPHEHEGTTTGRKQHWDGWAVVEQ
jgi:hypothetical protein